MCKFSGNNHGTSFETSNHYDYDYVSCFLEGNTHCSVHSIGDAAVVGLSLIRTHLGFGQYGIWQDSTTLGAGYAGLTLIDCPIEAVMSCAMMRAMTSVGPPAAKPTMMRTGLAGNGCAPSA